MLQSMVLSPVFGRNVAPLELVVGQCYTCVYNGKGRHFRVEELTPNPKEGSPCVRVFDYTADAPIGGYRTFTLSNIDNIQKV